MLDHHNSAYSYQKAAIRKLSKDCRQYSEPSRFIFVLQRHLNADVQNSFVTKGRDQLALVVVTVGVSILEVKVTFFQ